MRVAFCIRGSVRSWDVCNRFIFETFDFSKIANHVEVDWFFDTWDYDSFTYCDVDDDTKEAVAKRVTNKMSQDEIDAIRLTFVKNRKRLVSLNTHRFEPNLNPAESFLKLVFLSNHSKRCHELSGNFKYDVVVQIRPDVIYRYLDNEIDKKRHQDFLRSILSSKDTYVINNMVDVDKNKKFVQHGTIDLDPMFNTEVADIPGISDVVFFGKSQVIDLLSKCYLYVRSKHNNIAYPHASFQEFITKTGLMITDFYPPWVIIRNMKIKGQYDYEQFKNSETLTRAELLDSAQKCTKIWYDLFKQFKII